MKTEIKKRIDQLNHGEIPNGYKKTEFGIFPCDWETDKTFGDLFDFYGGLSKSRDELGKEGHAYLHYGDLHRGTFNWVSLAQYSQLPKCNITLKGKESCLMEDGDVAFLDASEDLEGTSRAVLIDNPENEPFIAGLHIIYGKSKDDRLEKWYKQYITASENVKKQFQRLSVGFKIYGVNHDSLHKIRVAYPPSLQEQARIAEILMKWDKAIDLYNKQIDRLNRFKSICLKKLFPAKGKTVPEWRFKEFAGAWEQRKLIDEVSSVDTGKSKFTSHESGKYEILGSTSVIGYDSSYDYEGDFLLTARVGANAGELYRHFGRVKISDNTVFIQGNQLDFIYYALLNFDIKRLSFGTGQPLVKASELKEQLIAMPSSKTEREYIGEFFSQLDNLITLHQRKRDMAMRQRKVLQQYLLNGIVRV